MKSIKELILEESYEKLKHGDKVQWLDINGDKCYGVVIGQTDWDEYSVKDAITDAQTYRRGRDMNKVSSFPKFPHEIEAEKEGRTKDNSKYQRELNKIQDKLTSIYDEMEADPEVIEYATRGEDPYNIPKWKEILDPLYKKQTEIYKKMK